MMRLFRPVSTMMDQLTYPRKMALLAVILAVPLAVITSLLLSETNRKLDFARTEKTGAEYYQLAMRLQQNVQEHRGLTYAVLSGDGAFRERLAAVGQETENRIRSIEAVKATNGAALASSPEWAALKRRWQEIRTPAITVHADESFENHTHLVKDILSLMGQISDTYNLKFDPAIDNSYLMHTLTFRLPYLTETLGQARAYGVGMTRRKAVTLPEKAKVIALSGNADMMLEQVEHDMQMVFRINPALRQLLEGPLNEAVTSTNAFLEVIDRDVVNTPAIEMEPAKYFSTATRAIDRCYYLSEAAIPAFNRLLGSRIGDLAARRNLLVAFIVASALLIVVFFNGVYRSVVDALSSLVEASGQIAGGNLGWRVDIRGRDETALVGASFNEMAGALEENIAERRRAEAELVENNRQLEMGARYDQSYGETMALFSSTYDRDKIMRGTLSLLSEIHPFPVSAVYTYDEWTGCFNCVASHGAPGALKQQFKLGEGLPGQAAVDRKSFVIEENKHLPLTIETGIASVNPAAIAVSPVFFQEKIMGLLVIASTERLTNRDLEFLTRLSTQVGVALNNLKQYSDLIELSNQLRLRGEEIADKNRQLEQANRMKSEFLANMSHELRTPLNAIIGFSDLMKDGLAGPLTAKQAEYTTNIYSSGEHLLSLINDILDLSKVEAGKMELDIEGVNVPEILETSLHIVKEKAMGRRIRLESKIDGTVGAVRLDARKLKQIVYNLLSNAVKFTQEGGTVLLEAGWIKGTPADHLEISVKDNGIGIPEERLKDIFEPFVQIDSSTSRKHEGTGLGLALVKRLAELHGGTVLVTSEVGKGSCFTVRLPCRTEGLPFPEVSRPASRLPETTPAEGPVQVLMIEDDDMAAEFMRVQLEAEGYRVARVSTAEEGLALASRHTPELIILDILLPGMDGYEFLMKTRWEWDLREVPVVIVSIVADESKGFAMGATTVLQKPIRKEELISAIEGLGLCPETGGRHATLLVVDDDPRAVEIVAGHIERCGCAVLRAYGGQEGIDLASNHVPDLIILDLMMPDVSGFDVVYELKSRPATAGIPIIILTAKIISREDMEALNGDVLKIVQKAGFDRQDFMAEVRRVAKKA